MINKYNIALEKVEMTEANGDSPEKVKILAKWVAAKPSLYIGLWI